MLRAQPPLPANSIIRSQTIPMQEKIRISNIVNDGGAPPIPRQIHGVPDLNPKSGRHHTACIACSIFFRENKFIGTVG